jgi:hypothetical protein
MRYTTKPTPPPQCTSSRSPRRERSDNQNVSHHAYLHGPIFKRQARTPGRKVQPYHVPSVHEKLQQETNSSVVYESIPEAAASASDQAPYFWLRDGYTALTFSLCIQDNIYVDPEIWTRILKERGVTAILDELEYLLCLKLKFQEQLELSDDDTERLHYSIVLACNALAQSTFEVSDNYNPDEETPTEEDQVAYRCIHYIHNIIFCNLAMFGDHKLRIAASAMSALTNLVSTHGHRFLFCQKPWLNVTAMTLHHMIKSTGEFRTDDDGSLDQPTVYEIPAYEGAGAPVLRFQIATHWSNELATQFCIFLSVMALDDDTRQDPNFPADTADLIVYCMRYCCQNAVVQVWGCRALSNVLYDLKETTLSNFFKAGEEEGVTEEEDDGEGEELQPHGSDDTGAPSSAEEVHVESEDMYYFDEVGEKHFYDIHDTATGIDHTEIDAKWENRQVQIIWQLREMKERHGGRGNPDIEYEMNRVYERIGPDPMEETLYIVLEEDRD